MSEETQLVIIAAVLDERQLTLFREDGSTYIIFQGDPRIQPILDVAMKLLKQEGDRAIVSIAEVNQYANFEEKTGGMVKLFRVAKSKVKEFFGKTEAAPIKPIALGKVPGRDQPLMTAVVAKREPINPETGERMTKQESAVAEIMQHATPVTSEAFVAPKVAMEEEVEKDDAHQDTLIAVVDGQVIPGVEALQPQFAAAAESDKPIGMVKFLERLSKVMGKRRHSVEDLLKFLKRGDLPIADDGSIVIYKILKRKHNEKDVFVDCHSGNVPQKVGSYVHMDEDMVDPNRRNECSNGLHVARRAYLGNFSGDVCVLAKVAPEDVIAVPDYDANKMRVCGYHILATLSPETFSKLKSNRAMTDNEAERIILGKVLAGDHVGILEKVKITGPKGTGVEITKTGELPLKPIPKAPVVQASALPENGLMSPPVDVQDVATKAAERKVHVDQGKPGSDHTVEVTVQGDKVIDIKEVVENPPHMPVVEQALTEAEPVKQLSVKEKAQAMYVAMYAVNGNIELTQKLAADLVLFKKEKKKSWPDLGISAENGEAVMRIAADALPKKGAIFTNDKTIAKAQAKVEAPATGKKGPREEIRELLNQPPTSAIADLVWLLKKRAKKGWLVLGVTEAEVKVIEELRTK